MEPRRNHLIATIPLLIALLAACAPSPAPGSATATKVIIGAPTISGAEATPTPAAGAPTQAASGGCVNEYYPVGSGDSWSYSSSGSVVGDYSYTRTLAGVSDSGFTFSDDFSAGVIRTTKWGCKDGNLTALETGSGSGINSSTGMKVTIDSVTASGYAIPATFETGNTWTENLEFNTTNEANGKVTGTGKTLSQTSCMAGATESITVPAGKFDAVIVTCIVTTTVTATVKGVTNPPNSFITETTQWFVKGVGTVESISSGDSGNETIVLTSYTIP